jgi:general secretion pathway protein E
LGEWVNIQNVGFFLGSLLKRKDKNELQNASGDQVPDAASNSAEVPGPGFPQISAADFPDKPPMINGLSPQLMRQWRVVTLSMDDSEARVAMATPQDLYLRELLESIYQKPVRPFLASEEDILAAVYR